MPSKFPAQRRTMQAAANNPAVAAKTGISPSVAREFAAADAAKSRPKAKAPAWNARTGRKTRQYKGA